MSRPQPSASASTAFSTFDPFATHPFTSLESPSSRNLHQFDDSSETQPEQRGSTSSYNVHLTRAMNAPVQPLQPPTSSSPSFGSSMTLNPPSPRPQGSQGHVFTDLRSELDRRRGQKGAADDLPVLKKKTYIYDGF